jgi:hypothetical protein
MFEKARVKIQDILKAKKPYKLPASIENDIDQYVKKVEERKINEYIN